MLTKASLLVLAMGGASTLAQAADNLIISEYVEGSSNNKAIELYNPTSASIDLSQYQLSFYFNGNTQAGSSISLSGVLAAGATFVIADNDASADILAVADMVSNASFFNGDDAIVLSSGTQVIDSLGRIGEDPGSEWGAGDLSTQDNTLRRDPALLVADTQTDDEVTLGSWQGFLKDDISDLGKFSADNTDPTDPDPTPGTLVCGETSTPIHAIQGATDLSPLNGQTVIVEAIVVSNQEAGLKGLFLQMADAETDADAHTSEGVFVYTGNAATGYQPGDRIRLQAKVTEYQGLTELTSVTEHSLCAANQALPTPAQVSLPFAAPSELEAFEGMGVSFSQPLVVNEVYNLGRYGEISLGSQRHFIGTQVASPGAAALAVSAANANDSILLDDGLTAQNPDPIGYPAPGLSAANTVRVGDKITGLDAVMHYGFGKYRVMPTETVNFVTANARTTEPVITEGDLKVASFNVLNYFNGDGQGAGFPTDRGADTLSEFNRQKAKIVSAMVGIGADVFGLMEIENDGFGANSAIADLVAGLNAAIGEARYSYIDPGVAAIGTDAISVGIIYRADKVTPNGAAAILSSANSPLDETGKPLFDDGKNRPTLTQAFSVAGSEESLVLAVNHLKSKGSDCAALGDPDVNDGQGNCNQTRSRAAKAAGIWLAEQYPEQGVLIIGDLNSYAKEDPLTAFKQADFTELFEHLNKVDAYSYVFSGESGQLDHALASGDLVDKIVDVTEWHINTDEPRILDYNEEFKSAQQLTDLYAADAYRSSDHDPVVISLALAPAKVAPVASFSLTQEGGTVTLASTSSDADGELVDFLWDLGDGTVATTPTLSHSYAVSGDYQLTLTVTDNDGLSHSVSQSISVVVAPQQQAPVAQIQHINLWLVDMFISTSYDEDGYLKKQKWTFNDGRRANGAIVWRFAKRGLNRVELMVKDNDGLTDTAELSFR
ncbi:ExeM/NucH family extracellular endonuclease [Shewanella salipaludis]|uniref:ExeM/NucH family extracellular endonuclease n=1 Tax=Shewanella salipaludis TaxID=2723052 RepID=A0A972FZ72_9GAMM|nr:ExeM/NucH family extracellular endonuclease [Shewanella salipaludis]